MKKLFAIIAAALIIPSVFLPQQTGAQPPQKMSYQAIIRNASNTLVTSHLVGIQISILQGSVNGTVVYTETQTTTTNANGLISIEIGGGTGFDAINWANDLYFIKTETDPAGGTNYTITGTSQLLSVPYALYAKTAENLNGGITELDPVFVAAPANGITSTNISNWTTAYSWGNHAGLYRPIGYVPVWSEITSNPFVFTSVAANQLLKYDSTYDKWANWTPNFLTSYTETDPIWTASSANYYLKTNMQTSGESQLHFNNLTNKPTTIAGYGITDGVTTTGNQTIAGNKTFSGTISVPTPINVTDAVNKAYLTIHVSTTGDTLYFGNGQYIIIPGISAANPPGPNTVTDIDGNIYNSVTIGTQVWMAENLKTTKYLNGDLIETTATATLDISSESAPKYQWAYDGNESKAPLYGRLYTYYAVTDSRKLCPTGWHVPIDAEWTILTTYLGNELVAGGKLKDSDTAHWHGPNTGATNETGFTALPGGYRIPGGTFGYIGYLGYWWSSTEFDTDYAWYRYMDYKGSYVARENAYERSGFSVRCVRDF
jgi:uncharacterized protein (TIGR02145 family)